MQDQHNLKLKHLQRYFVPKDVDSKVILQAFKMQQNRRAVTTQRYKQQIMQQQVQQQVDRIGLLKVTGKEASHFSQQRSKTMKRTLNSIELPQKISSDILRHAQIAALKFPASMQVSKQSISINPRSMLLAHLKAAQQAYHNDITQDCLQIDKVNKMSRDTNRRSIQSRQFRQGSRQLSQGKRDTINQLRTESIWQNLAVLSQADKMQYYQKMILSDPSLYKRIMAAYSYSKRQIDKDNFKNNMRRLAQKRQSLYQGKVRSSGQLPPFDSKKRSYSEYQQFLLSVLMSNKMILMPAGDVHYRAYICKGNNGLLVRNMLKSRPWWGLRTANDMPSCNLIWTQWRRKKVTNILQKSVSKFAGYEAKKVQINVNFNNKQHAQLARHKLNNMQRVLDTRDDQIWKFYDKSPHSQKYLSFRKTGQQTIQTSATRVLRQLNFDIKPLDKNAKAHNHVAGCLQLHSKKLLFLNLKRYYQKQGKDVFEVVPLTFHIKEGPEDKQFIRFSAYFQRQQLRKGKQQSSRNIWIIKPGQNSNRGNGIQISSTISQISQMARNKCKNNRSLIIQKYLQNPCLYNKRKFDMRCYMLVTCVNGIIKGYWYEQGYIRTASKQFGLKQLGNKFMHLTNDAIQKRSQEYGKFQNHNKITYAQFMQYLTQNQQSPQMFSRAQIKIKEIASDLMKATAHLLSPQRQSYGFQLFGLDFMLDQQLQPYLIEANSNPCLELGGPVLGSIIPALIQNVLRVAVDPVFPPPSNQANKNRFSPNSCFENNKFTLIYDSFYDYIKGETAHVECQEDDQEMQGQQQTNIQ